MEEHEGNKQYIEDGIWARLVILEQVEYSFFSTFLVFIFISTLFVTISYIFVYILILITCKWRNVLNVFCCANALLWCNVSCQCVATLLRNWLINMKLRDCNLDNVSKPIAKPEFLTLYCMSIYSLFLSPTTMKTKHQHVSNNV